MGAGAIVEAAGRRRVLSKHLGIGTNNLAEYGGLILGLKEALAAGATEATIRGDSQLILRQLEGKYAVKAPGLKPKFAEAKALLAQFDKVRLEWIPRDQNGAADQAARDALS